VGFADLIDHGAQHALGIVTFAEKAPVERIEPNSPADVQQKATTCQHRIEQASLAQDLS
jgi:hypothetical protein